jgi:hypothetical protein
MRREKEVTKWITSRTHIEAWAGRPNRETVINNDDLVDLQITFGSAKNFDDFLSKI